ncbi:MAG TPA: helix-turn-helix transcriptional regulator [Solirubrobacteraceae bacterium]|jgi:hypothetical protein
MRPAYAGLRIGAKHAIRGNPVVLGRKFCADCGRWRLVLDFSPQKRGGSLYSPYCHVCTARRHRRYHHGPHSAEWWEQRREYARIWSQTQRRMAGKPERQWTLARVVDKPEHAFLPSEPLGEELRRYLAVNGNGHLRSGDVGFGVKGLAELTGVQERSIGRMLTGESAHIRIDLADKLAVAIGVPLALIYGDTPTISNLNGLGPS